MKNLWVVRLDAIEGTGMQQAVGIKTRRQKLGIQVGDKIIGASKDWKGFHFLWYATASQIDHRPLEEYKDTPEEKALHLFWISLSELKEFPETSDLQELRYSLKKVWRPEKPGVHFKQQYTRLTEADFEVLVSGRIFWARTALLQFLDALPDDIRAEIALKIDRDQEAFRRPTFRSRWSRFRSYLDHEYIPVANMFAGIREGMEELQDVLPSRLYFSDSNGENRDSINDQVGYFMEFLNALHGADQRTILDEIDAQIEHESASEQRFEKQFADSPWLPTIRKS